MGLLDGGLAKVFSAAFAGLYLPATIHRRAAPVYDEGGSVIDGEWTDEPCRAQIDNATESMRRSPGYTDQDQRILVLASGVATITTDDEITAGGKRWGVASVGRDPAGAYFDLRGTAA